MIIFNSFIDIYWGEGMLFSVSFKIKFLKLKDYVMRRLRLENSDITILSNNCIGGIIYHKLGLRFKSPTINLLIGLSGVC